MLRTDEMTQINQLNFGHVEADDCWEQQCVDFHWSPIYARVDEQLVMCYTEPTLPVSRKMNYHLYLNLVQIVIFKNTWNYFSAPVVSEQPSQYLAMDLGYGGMAKSTLLVWRSTL